MNVTFAKSLSSIGTFTLRRTLTPSTFTPVKRTISSFTPIVYNTLTRKANTCVTVAAQYQPQQQRQQQQQLVLSPRFYTSSNAPATLDPSSVVDMKYVDDLVRDADDVSNELYIYIYSIISTYSIQIEISLLFKTRDRKKEIVRTIQRIQ